MTFDAFWIGAIFFAIGFATLMGVGIAILLIELICWSYAWVIGSLATLGSSFSSRLRRWRLASH